MSHRRRLASFSFFLSCLRTARISRVFLFPSVLSKIFTVSFGRVGGAEVLETPKNLFKNLFKI